MTAERRFDDTKNKVPSFELLLGLEVVSRLNEPFQRNDERKVRFFFVRVSGSLLTVSNTYPLAFIPNEDTEPRPNTSPYDLEPRRLPSSFRNRHTSRLPQTR
jgi:hypothetical protein